MTDEKAREIAHGIIQGYIGPDHKVIDMKAFFSALVQAFKCDCADRPNAAADRPNAADEWDMSGYLQEVGLVCQHWSYLEYMLEVAVWWLEDQPEQPISTKRDCAPLAERAAALAPGQLCPDEADLMESIKFEVIRLTPERNLAVHGRGELLPDETVRVTATRGPYANAPQRMSPEKIGALNRDLATVIDALNILLAKHGVVTTS